MLKTVCNPMWLHEDFQEKKIAKHRLKHRLLGSQTGKWLWGCPACLRSGSQSRASPSVCDQWPPWYILCHQKVPRSSLEGAASGWRPPSDPTVSSALAQHGWGNLPFASLHKAAETAFTTLPEQRDPPSNSRPNCCLNFISVLHPWQMERIRA